MQFGAQFFPDVGPAEKPAAQYFTECLDLAVEAERLGFSHVRTVEHYFEPYGGYSPNPLTFLAALSQRTSRVRLVTGAVLPIFNHPLKLAGEIAMVDALSNGRLDVGFARAFLPHEFRRFGVSPDESVARYREGLEQIDLLLREENVAHEGKFHQFPATTSLPRPTQKPRPKFYVACQGTADSFEFAGRAGHAVMAIPLPGGRIKDLVTVYRDAWRKAGHPGRGEVMLVFHMYCAADAQAARETARPYLDHYFKSLVAAASEWAGGLTSKDYIGYDKMVESLRKTTLENQIASGAAWVGSPTELRDTVGGLFDRFGEFEHASLQLNFHMLPFDKALSSLRLFATEVMPHAPGSKM